MFILKGQFAICNDRHSLVFDRKTIVSGMPQSHNVLPHGWNPTIYQIAYAISPLDVPFAAINTGRGICREGRAHEWIRRITMCCVTLVTVIYHSVLIAIGNMSISVVCTAHLPKYLLQRECCHAKTRAHRIMGISYDSEHRRPSPSPSNIQAVWVNF